MKCQICGKKTTWDESFGKEEFIVCPRCFEALHKMTHSKRDEVFDFVIAVGWIRKRAKKEPVKK